MRDAIALQTKWWVLSVATALLAARLAGATPVISHGSMNEPLNNGPWNKGPSNPGTLKKWQPEAMPQPGCGTGPRMPRDSAPKFQPPPQETEMPEPTKIEPAPEPEPSRGPAPTVTVPPHSGRNLEGFEAATMIQKRCAVCHGGEGKAPRFPAFVTDWSSWQVRLGDKSHTEHKTAMKWLDSFHNMVGLSDSMLNVAHSKAKKMGEDFPEEDRNALRGFIKSQFQTFHQKGKMSDTRTSSPIAMVGQKKLPMYEAAIKGLKVTDPRIAALLNSYDVIYDHDGLPRAHQMPNHGVYSGGRGLGVGLRAIGDRTPSPPVGHILDGKGKWLAPFQDGVGMSADTKGNGTFFLVKLPRDEKNERMPIVTWNERFRFKNYVQPDEFHTQRISYPVGTQFAEVRYTKVGNQTFVHTVLTRIKRNDASGKTFWDPDVLVPYPTAESFRERITKEPGWKNDPTLTKWVSQAESGGKTDHIKSSLGNLFRTGQTKSAEMTGKTVDLTGMSAEKFAKFFKDQPLRSAKGGAGFGMTGEPFPTNYHMGAAKVTVENCANCHREFGRPFRELARTEEALSSTYLYGNVGAGNDGINSFYIQDPRRLPEFMTVQDNRSNNPALQAAGLIRRVAGEPRDATYRLVNP